MAENRRLPRLALALAATLLSVAAGAAAVEAYARHEHLDLRRARAIAVDQRAVMSTELRPAPDDWGVPYLPRSFALDEGGFDTDWGRCDWDSDKPTVLILGDSTTRQGGGRRAEDGPGDEARRTWAGLVARGLADRYQVCVLAEDGYHPVHHAALARKVAEHTDIAHIVVLLCGNDLSDWIPLVALPGDAAGQLTLYEVPSVAPVWPPLWNDWLHRHSEAFRWFSWQMAERTGNRYDVPIDVPLQPWHEQLDVVAAIAPTTLFYVDRLEDPETSVAPDGVVRARLDQRGMAYTRIAFEPPWGRWRRQRDDVVHLSDAAHEVAAARMLPIIEADLAR